MLCSPLPPCVPSIVLQLTLISIDRFNCHTTSTSVDKALIRRRLATITISKPDANPSRSTLQSVHSFLMPRLD